MITLYVSVVTVIDRWSVPRLGGQLATWEGTQRMDPKKPAAGVKANAFAGINPQGRASVKVGLEEKISGPTGTFSSVSVHIEVMARCDQDQESIDHARSVLMKEGLAALDHYMAPAVRLLHEHTRKQQD